MILLLSLRCVCVCVCVRPSVRPCVRACAGACVCALPFYCILWQLFLFWLPDLFYLCVCIRCLSVLYLCESVVFLFSVHTFFIFPLSLCVCSLPLCSVCDLFIFIQRAFLVLPLSLSLCVCVCVCVCVRCHYLFIVFYCVCSFVLGTAVSFCVCDRCPSVLSVSLSLSLFVCACVFIAMALMVMVVALVTPMHPYFTLSDHPQCHPHHQPHSRSHVDLEAMIIPILILKIPLRATPRLANPTHTSP